jgi:hypothetical protein
MNSSNEAKKRSIVGARLANLCRLETDRDDGQARETAPAEGPP